MENDVCETTLWKMGHVNGARLGIDAVMLLCCQVPKNRFLILGYTDVPAPYSREDSPVRGTSYSCCVVLSISCHPSSYVATAVEGSFDRRSECRQEGTLTPRRLPAFEQTP